MINFPISNNKPKKIKLENKSDARKGRLTTDAQCGSATRVLLGLIILGEDFFAISYCLLYHRWLRFFCSREVNLLINLIKIFMNFQPKFRHLYMFVGQVKCFFRNFTNDDISRLYTLTSVCK